MRLWTPYEEAAQQNKLWTPKLIRSSLAYWIDPARLDASYSGTSITSIPDVSGNGQALSNLGGTRVFSRMGLRGRPAFDFQLGQAYGASSVACGSAGSFIAAAVFTLRSTAANQFRILSCGNADDWNSNTYAALMCRESPYGLRINSTWSAASQLVTTSGIAYDTPMIFVVYRDGTNAYHRLNGVTTAGPSSSALSLGTVTFRIGTYLLSTTDTTSRMDGLIAEQMVALSYSLPLLQKIEGHLSHKHGVPLRGDHPHLYAPPLLHGG